MESKQTNKTNKQKPQKYWDERSLQTTMFLLPFPQSTAVKENVLCKELKI
jgi:hypothetical protein